MKKLTGRLFKYLLVIIIFDLVVGALALTIADYKDKTPIYYEEKMPGFFGRMNEALRDYIGELHFKELVTNDFKQVIDKMKYKSPNVVKTRRVVEQSPVAMGETLLLNGFSLEYRKNPHRLSNVEASIDGITYDAAGSRVRGVANVAFDGGDWSRIDGIRYAISFQPLASRKVKFAHLSESIRMTGGHERVAVRLDLAELGLAEYSEVAVVLRGFKFDTGDEYPDGYNIKGIKVKLQPVARAGRYLDMDVVMEFKAGEVAFRPDPGYFYTCDAQVFYTLVGTDEGSFTRTDHHYMLLNREHAPERVQRVTVDVGPGPGIVVPALEGFEMDVHSTKGRYARVISVSLDGAEYDPEKGEATVLCNGYLSNSGTFAGALDVRFVADLVFIKLPEGKLVDPVRLSGEMSDVTATSSLDVEAGI